MRTRKLGERLGGHKAAHGDAAGVCVLIWDCGCEVRL
jgi:hypothetical protein